MYKPFLWLMVIWAETRDLTKASVFENWVKRVYIKGFGFLVRWFGFNT